MTHPRLESAWFQPANLSSSDNWFHQSLLSSNAQRVCRYVEVKVVAAAAAAGVKLKKVSAPLTAPNAADACTQMCAAAKVDCVNDVMCDAEAARRRRHLLAAFTATLAMPADSAAAASTEGNLKVGAVQVERS